MYRTVLNEKVMKKELERKDNEPIYRWVERLSKELHLTKEQKEALHEVATEAYIKGSNDAEEIPIF